MPWFIISLTLVKILNENVIVFLADPFGVSNRYEYVEGL